MLTMIIRKILALELFVVQQLFEFYIFSRKEYQTNLSIIRDIFDTRHYQKDTCM